MGTIYVDTGGAATNSGSTDQNTANLSGTGDATVSGSVVQLTAGTDLSGVVTTAGATQSSIYLAQATNTNQKIFWITAKDDALDQVTVSVAPTGITGSNWAIGGRFVWTAASIEAAVRAGDTIILNNSPASAAADWITTRVAGDSTSGYITLKGKSGVRPVVTVTNTLQCIEAGAFVLWKFENVELAQQGASGNVVTTNGAAAGLLFYNVKVSDGGSYGLSLSGGGNRTVACEVTGVTLGIAQGNSTSSAHVGNYIHDVSVDGILISVTTPVVVLLNNIVDTAAGRGIYLSGGPTSVNISSIIGNTIYGCGDSGLEVADADAMVFLLNNIFAENGNAAGEYNIEWVAGNAELVSFHAWNVFYHSGGGGGANLSGLTVNAQVASSEFTTDPGFTNAAGADFSISSTSPAKAAGFPGVFLGAGCTGYLDIGAVQRQEPSGGIGALVGGSLIR